MKSSNDVMTGGGGFDGQDKLKAALAVPVAVAAAEAEVSSIRHELREANTTLTAAVQEHHRVASRGHTDSALARDVDAAQRRVVEIEARLAVARADMARAREEWAPRFAADMAPWRHTAGVKVQAAAEAVEDAVEILSAIESHAIRHGIDAGRLSHALPRDLRRLADRLKGAAW